jgi:hypothetical protein
VNSRKCRVESSEEMEFKCWKVRSLSMCMESVELVHNICGAPLQQLFYSCKPHMFALVECCPKHLFIEIKCNKWSCR